MPEKKKGKKTLIALIIAAVVILLIIGALVWYFAFGQTNNEVFKKPVESTSQTERTTESTTEKITEGETAPTVGNGASNNYTVNQDDDGNEYYTYTTIPINSENMKEINSDLYAWIYLPNTQIDNPIAQATDKDDSYYLTHDAYGNYSVFGTIYTEKINAKDFSDPNTMIYGHEMLNGSMFQNLHNYEDAAYFNKNPYFYIFTENRVLTYEVFSAFLYDDRHIMYAFDFTTEAGYQSFLNEALNPHSDNANVREGVEVTTSDKIVTLSTCDGLNSNSRYLVVGVLVNDAIAQ